VGFWGPGRASLISVVVGDEGDYFVGFEEFAAFEEAKLYEEGDAGYDAAGVLDELAHGAGGATGGEEVVDDEHAGAFRYAIGVDLQRVLAVLELVSGGDGLSGELVGAAGENEALLGAVGEGSAEDEAAGFRGEDAGVIHPFGGPGHPVDGGLEGRTVLYEGGYVFEGDASLGEVWDLPYAAPYLFDRRVQGVGAKKSL